MIPRALCALALALALSPPLIGARPGGPPVDLARLMADEPAPTLGDYHLFGDPGPRDPAPTLTPYGLNTPLFSDYAQKERYLYLPPGAAARYTSQGALGFPVGATLIKTFAYPADLRAPREKVRFIETRLLIRKAAGWTALTYVWNDAQTQAVLKKAGLRVPVSFIDAAGAARAVDYQVPNLNQCKACHALNGAIVPIGPKARNLDGEFAYAEGAENQLAHWSRLGLLTGAPAPGAVSALPRWDDPAAPIEGRARAYLDVNCGHCHNPGGLASNSGLYLTFEEARPSALGIGKRPVAAGRGSGGLAVSIEPGHPERSILIYRMASTEPGVMMPQIGRTVAHQEGLEVVRAYVAGLAAATPAKGE